jgi:hypothetical protein
VGTKETALTKAIVSELAKTGWLCEKLHGGMYMSGWPDLYCRHPEHGERWVEVKVLGNKLEETQEAWMRRWEKYGAKAYVLHQPEGAERTILGTPNWRYYIRGGLF